MTLLSHICNNGSMAATCCCRCIGKTHPFKTGKQQCPDSACACATELQRLGAPTALLAAAGHLCIGGAAGGITCVPLPSLRRGSAEGALELRDAGGVGRLLTSLFARCAAWPSLWLFSELSCTRAWAACSPPYLPGVHQISFSG